MTNQERKKQRASMLAYAIRKGFGSPKHKAALARELARLRRELDCICGAGFGFNLSCPVHKPRGRTIDDRDYPVDYFD